MAPTHSFLRSSLFLSLSLTALARAESAHRRGAHGLDRYHGHRHHHRQEEASAVPVIEDDSMMSIVPIPMPIETDNVSDMTMTEEEPMMSILPFPMPIGTDNVEDIPGPVETDATVPEEEEEQMFSILPFPMPIETHMVTDAEPLPIETLPATASEEELMYSILPFPNPIETESVSDMPLTTIPIIPIPTDLSPEVIPIMPAPTNLDVPFETAAIPFEQGPEPTLIAEAPTPILISAPAPPPSAGANLIQDIQHIEEGLNNLPNDLLAFIMAMQDRLQGLEDVLSSLVTSGVPPPAQPTIPPPDESVPTVVLPTLPEVTLTPDITTDVGTVSAIPLPPTPPATSLCRPAGAGPLVPCPERDTTLTSTSTVAATTTFVPPIGTGNATWANNTQPTPAIQPVPTDYSFDASSEDNVAVYYGQTQATEVGGLVSLCQDPNVDIVNLAFLFSFTYPRGYPSIDFGPGCTGPNAFQETQAPGLSDCATLAPEIAACQALGKKVLVSLGGESSNTSFTSDDQAVQLAATLWNLFGGGDGETSELRPFGPDIVVDGFDIANENQETASYTTFALALRSQFSQDDSKTYYLSTAPACPIPDPSIPIGALLLSDFVWVQFYDNPACELGSEGFQDSFDAWSELLANSTGFDSSASDGVEPRLFVGVGAWEGAGTGYVEGAGLSSEISLARELYVENFGGILLWDGSEGVLNVDEYGVDFLQYAKNALH
ncbi:hypothetical protein MBLNU230_g7731t1 [Neophaeotheca triangularis]